MPEAVSPHHDDHYGRVARHLADRISETGAGGEARRPLGLAVVGGLVVSQILTLYITPVVYLYLDRLVSRRRERQSTKAASGWPAEGTLVKQ